MDIMALIHKTFNAVNYAYFWNLALDQTSTYLQRKNAPSVPGSITAAYAVAADSNPHCVKQTSSQQSACAQLNDVSPAPHTRWAQKQTEVRLPNPKLKWEQIWIKLK